MSGILFSLIPLISWGFSDYGASKLSKFNPIAVGACSSLVGSIWAVIFILWKGIPAFGMHEALLAVITALCVNAAFMTFVKAYSYGAVGVVTPIANSYAVIVAVLSAVFAGSTLPIGGWMAIGIVITGMVLLTYKRDEAHSIDAFRKSVSFALAAWVFFGLGFFFFDLAATQAWYDNFTIFQVVNLVVAWILVVALVPNTERNSQIKVILRTRWLLVPGILGTAGSVGLFMAIDAIGSATVPAAIGAGSPLITSLLAYYLDHEHLRLIQRIGGCGIVAGIIVLSINAS